jgi:choline transporter-like protein 2/4/5
MFNKIRLAIAVIKTATLFVRDNFSIIFLPIVLALIMGAIWVWWIISILYVIALGTITGQGTTPFASVTWDEEQRRMIWYFIFG